MDLIDMPKEARVMEDTVKILAVDDEPDLRGLLRILLQNKGFAVEEAASGTEAVEKIRENPDYDLVIMDIMMPGLDGVEACRQIREFSKVPLLFLTARDQMQDKAQAYGSGGDDYLAKPFSQSELMMKVESLLRRYRVYRGKEPAAGEDGIQIDEERKTVRKNGAAVELTDKEFAILLLLYRNRGQILDVRTVYEGAWGEKYLPSSNNTVMVHILNLRKKLEQDPANPRLIRTVWGKGYQFG